jgi:predicted nucleic acid-binding protein
VILADTSVWVDHLRRGSGGLMTLLDSEEVCCHPFIAGELACGNLRQRAEILRLLTRLPTIPVAEHGEVLHLVERNRLMGSGIGWIDAHLLAAAVVSGARLWTLDRPLAAAASRIGVAAP